MATSRNGSAPPVHHDEIQWRPYFGREGFDQRAAAEDMKF